MSGVAHVSNQPWRDERKTSLAKTDSIFKRLSERYRKKDVTSSFKTLIRATSEKLRGHRFDVDSDSELEQADKIGVERQGGVGNRSGTEADEATEGCSCDPMSPSTSTANGVESSRYMNRSPGPGFSAQAVETSSLSIIKMRSRIHRAKKRVAAARDMITDVGYKIIKGHARIPLAREAVWMINNPVFEQGSDPVVIWIDSKFN